MRGYRMHILKHRRLFLLYFREPSKYSFSRNIPCTGNLCLCTPGKFLKFPFSGYRISFFNGLFGFYSQVEELQKDARLFFN